MRAGSLYLCQLHLLTYFKPLHRLPLQKIELAMVADELQTIAKKRGPVAANRGRSTLSAFYAWCIGTGLAKDNPVSGTFKPSEEKSRDRVLSDSELVKIWNAAPANDYGRIVKLLLLTGQRRDEIAELKWAEISDEGDMISLPSPRTKNNRPHDIPLSPQAMRCAWRGADGRWPRQRFRARKERLQRLLAIQGGAGRSQWRHRLDAARSAPHHGHPHGRPWRPAPHCRGGVEPRLGPQGWRGRNLQPQRLRRGEARRAGLLWGSYVKSLLAKAEGANVTTIAGGVMSVTVQDAWPCGQGEWE